jgi:hypothetical protein
MIFCSPRTHPRDHQNTCCIVYACHEECLGSRIEIYDVGYKYRPGTVRVLLTITAKGTMCRLNMSRRHLINIYTHARYRHLFLHIQLSQYYTGCLHLQMNLSKQTLHHFHLRPYCVRLCVIKKQHIEWHGYQYAPKFLSDNNYIGIAFYY